MTKLEIFEVILKDAVKQFNSEKSKAEKRKLIKSEAKEMFDCFGSATPYFLQYATNGIYGFLMHLKYTPYEGLTQNRKNAACVLSDCMDFATLARFEDWHSNEITKQIFYALQHDKFLQSLEKVYDKEIKGCLRGFNEYVKSMNENKNNLS